jgi:hypothetical protein
MQPLVLSDSRTRNTCTWTEPWARSFPMAAISTVLSGPLPSSMRWGPQRRMGLSDSSFDVPPSPAISRRTSIPRSPATINSALPPGSFCLRAARPFPATTSENSATWLAGCGSQSASSAATGTALDATSHSSSATATEDTRTRQLVRHIPFLVLRMSGSSTG